MSTLKYVFFISLIIFVSLFAAKNMHTVEVYFFDGSSANHTIKVPTMVLLSGAFGLGFIAGPAIGGILAGSDIANTNFTLPSLVAAGFSGLALIFATIFLKESLTLELRSDISSQTSTERWTRLNLTISRPEVPATLFLTFLAVF